MLCVVGNDVPLARAVRDELEARGLAVSPLALEGPRLTAIVVERMDGSGLDPVVEGEGLDEARRAVTVRGGEVVVVTDRPDGDAALRALRRSGVPYTVVRRGAPIDDAPPRLALLPPTLSAAVTTRRQLAHELATEHAEGRLGTGASLDLGRTRRGADVADALRAAGSSAWAVPAWLHAVAAMLGLAFDADGSGRLVPVRRALSLARLPMALPWLALVVALSASPARAQEACAHAEHDAARVARLGRIAAALDPGTSEKADAEARARAASERVSPLREAVTQTFESLRRTALASASGRAAGRLEAVRLSFGDDGLLPAEAVSRGCGPDHLADEAWVSRALDVVVVCPGFLLLEADAAAAREEASIAGAVAAASAFLLAHELGHVIDGRGNDARAERAADEHAATLVAGVPSIDAGRALAPFCGLSADAAHEGGRARVERALDIVEERRSGDALEERRS